MAYSIEDQYNLDLNWYFIDHYYHPCHVASGGGLLPKIMIENDRNNNNLNRAVLEIQGNYEIERNPKAVGIIQQQGVQNIEGYFRDFETMARRGFFSFDKYDLTDPEDKRYFLVAYPKYVDYQDSYPIEDKFIKKIPRLRGTVHPWYYNPINLIKYFDKLH